MKKDIKALIKSQKYDEALKEIENILGTTHFDLNKNEDEEKYFELIQLKITAETLTGKKDEFVADLVRKEKNPSKIEYLFDGGNKISLQLNNQFRIPCDAYVGIINPITHFDESTGAGPKGEFIKRLGNLEIKRQIQVYKDLKEGDYIVLHHPNLSALYSYHILFDHDSYENEKNLTKGIQRVLNDAVRKNLKILSFFPLGFGTALRSKKELQHKIKYEIASSSVEPIIDYFFTHTKDSMPEIYFNFVNADTMFTYDKVVYSLSKMGKAYFLQMKSIDRREKNLVRAALTLDPEFTERLKEIKYSLDDDSIILLTGETGVGKSFLAKVIHDNSIRAGKPFEKMNCGMLKPNWIYVELFGAKKGAYTDCLEDREGAIGRAESGTLFLDEIGHTDMDTQKMLLKFLDDGTYRWLSDKVERKSNVRLILGTNANLEDMVAAGLFLPDLYERIAGRQFELPPLRERKSDITYFSEFVIEKLNENKNCEIKLSEEAKELLLGFKWPGNIRQLKFYLEYLHAKAFQLKQTLISADVIKKKPPRDYSYKNPSLFESLELTLKSFIKNWKEENGKMNKDLIEPILAKLYLDDFKLNKTNSGKIIGLDGTSGEDGPLMERYRAYTGAKSKFSR